MIMDRTFDPAIELKQLLDTPAYNLLELLADPIQWIISGGNDTKALLEQVQEKLNQLPTLGSTDLTNMLATWCCAESLHQSPQWETWKTVQKLQYNSWEIENWLNPVIFVIVEHQPMKQQNFMELAKTIFIETNNLFLQEPSESNQKTQPIQEKLFWQHQSKPLEQIWWGVDRHSQSSYGRISDWFQLLVTLDKEQAAQTLSIIKNPFLLQELIVRVTIQEGDKSKYWKYFIQKAPVAFEENGVWNGHLLVPITLVEFRHYLLRHNTNYDSTPEEKQQCKKQIEEWVSDNIPIIQQRQDAIPLLKRWSAWLMYRLLVEGGDKADDATSPAFIDATLLTAIGHLLTGKTFNSSEIPPDAMRWEPWCNLASCSYWAQNGTAIVSNYQVFLNEWDLSVDDWHEDKGQQLRDSSEHLISTYNQTRFPSDLAYLLAYPISEIDDWYKTWDSAIYLRELTEFGTRHDSYDNRSKASELLFFLWQVGFALFDLKAQHSSSANSDLARDLASLFQHLHTSLQEMIVIVDTLNREKWRLMPELLAVRRLLWEEQAETNNQGYVVFNKEDRPQFSDFLKSQKNQELETIQLINSALRNNVMPSTIKGHITDAGISIKQVIDKATRLNQISAKHYPLNTAMLSSLRQFIEIKNTM
ncbi:hypothetical protein [Thiothrix nivea]|uniref:Uncharacterized protein n=1 Tax=Thiothrix nivea (strain ATCC 35100 / DSM 5205 / JP2) TaxID=870187 RepID=A0A656HHU5_THINJ|nr:hypothetical protein [Thiothrix nivea]EIJ34789.1 hypothetical protein Thini_2226 [Thiothrix nivea DSM 5205]